MSVAGFSENRHLYVATDFLGHGTVNPKANEPHVQSRCREERSPTRPAGAAGGSGRENPPRRWRAKRKAEVVLRMWRGESRDALSRQTAVPVPRLAEGRPQALGGLEQALQIRAADAPAQRRLDEANRRIGELSLEVELLRARCEKQGPVVGRRSRP